MKETTNEIWNSKEEYLDYLFCAEAKILGQYIVGMEGGGGGGGGQPKYNFIFVIIGLIILHLEVNICS